MAQQRLSFSRRPSRTFLWQITYVRYQLTKGPCSNRTKTCAGGTGGAKERTSCLALGRAKAKRWLNSGSKWKPAARSSWLRNGTSKVKRHFLGTPLSPRFLECGWRRSGYQAEHGLFQNGGQSGVQINIIEQSRQRIMDDEELTR